jgi:hypothetical protein
MEDPYVLVCCEGSLEKLLSMFLNPKNNLPDLKECLLNALLYENYQVADYLVTLTTTTDLDYVFENLSQDRDFFDQYLYLSLKTKRNLDGGIESAILLEKHEELDTLLATGGNNYNYYLKILLQIPTVSFDWWHIKYLNYFIKQGVTSYGKLIYTEKIKFVDPDVLNMDIIIKDLRIFYTYQKYLHNFNNTEKILIKRGLPIDLIQDRNLLKEIKLRRSTVSKILYKCSQITPEIIDCTIVEYITL